MPHAEDRVLSFEAPVSQEESLLGALSIAGLDEVEICFGDPDTVLVRVYWPCEAGPAPAVDLCGVPNARRLPERRQSRAEWAGGWPTVTIGPFWLVPVLDHRPEPAPPPDLLPIRMDAGRGFGFGDHPSTKLALRAIAALPRPVGRRVLDVGCGNGVLSMAAVHLGAPEVWAVDIDPGARAAARTNAGLNKMKIAVSEPWPEPARYDLILANITPPVLKALAHDIVPRTAPQGRLILSGLPERELAEVVECFVPLRAVDWARDEEGWVAVTLVRG